MAKSLQPGPHELSSLMIEMAKSLGACAAGIATTETLAGGPPSADIAYALPGARAAVCYALPLDPEKIEPYLKKEAHEPHNRDKIRAVTMANGIAGEMSNFLVQLGYRSVPLLANFQYRNDGGLTYKDRVPPVSHRYLAVRSGIGHFGLSGHVITKEYGAAIVLGAFVTEAPLEPTEPLPEEDNYCDGCRLCLAACPSGFVSRDEMSVVTLGGRPFSYAKRNAYTRCAYVCGGYAGLDRSGKWSTWSPSRFPIPENDEDFPAAMDASVDAYVSRPMTDTLYYNSVKPGYRTEYTCSHCQLICHPDRDVRKRRYAMVTGSGVIVQEPDGSRKAVSPAAAKEKMQAMSPSRRAMYEPGQKEP